MGTKYTGKWSGLTAGKVVEKINHGVMLPLFLTREFPDLLPETQLTINYSHDNRSKEETRTVSSVDIFIVKWFLVLKIQDLWFFFL